MSLYDAVTREPSRNTYRLLGLAIEVPDDETIAKRRQDYGMEPRAQLIVTMEPLSYKLEGGKYGNQTRRFYDFSSGLTDDEVALVREAGFKGIPTNKRVVISKGKKAERHERLGQRFLAYARDAQLDLDIDPNTGQPTSKHIGVPVETIEFFDQFPTVAAKADGSFDKWDWQSTRDQFAVYVTKVVPDYVQPESVPVRIISADEQAAATVASSSGPSKEQLVKAFVAAGIVGTAESQWSDNPGAQLAATMRGQTQPDGVILATAAVNDAALNGRLIQYGVEQGAIAVVDGMIVAVG